jgi:Predicted ATPase
MKLAASVPVETVRAGKFVVVDGERQAFFSLITDVSLASTDARLTTEPPGGADPADALLRRVLAGSGTYGQVKLRPMLMLEKRPAGTPINDEDMRPVKTIPAHFRPVYEASEEDVARIFGSEDPDVAGGEAAARRYFHLGEPLDMETPVCLNLERFVERSSGIFGKSGTGKTFLTRICLCGILKSRRAVGLIFDMHSEYGWKGTVEGGRSEVRGLKQYFPTQVQMFTLDTASARRRGIRPDFEVRIPFSQIEPEDILLLAGELNLTPTAAETTYLLQGALRERWLETFLAMDAAAITAFAEQHNGNVAALAALQRRLRMMATACKGFLVPSLPDEDDAVRAILARLESGISVVLEFGQEGKALSYMLVANILTRRIHAAYVRRREEAMGDRSREPIPLVICIEEAHKFLSPALVSQTIFGTIARELRKYNVTLLVVDQRPSGIDDEVMSQIGTRVTCLLNDEKDIDSVLTGVPGARELRGVLASLDSKQQALILGHAVPMPVVIRTRTYDDEAFRRAMGGFNRAARALTHGEPSPPPLSRGGRGGPAAVSVSAPREADSANAPGTPLPPRERGGGEGSPKAGAAPDPAPASRALELDFD